MKDKYMVSLPIAKKLKEAGFKQDTEFWWYTFNSEKYPTLFTNAQAMEEYGRADNSRDYLFAAPIISELLEEMTNREIENYCYSKKLSFVDTFRKPDLISQVWLEAKKKKG